MCYLHGLWATAWKGSADRVVWVSRVCIFTATGRRSGFPGLSAVRGADRTTRGAERRCAGPHREDCPEVGVPLPAGPFLPVGSAPRREPSRRLGFWPPRPCGPRCRPEVGVPLPAGLSLPVGSAPRGSHPRRLGFRPPRRCAPLCRPEVGVPLPAGPSLPVGSAPRWEPSRRLGFWPPRPCGPLCRAPPGGLPRGRRSLACRAISPSGVRAETGAIPPIGVFAAAALRAAAPTGGRRSKPSPCFFQSSDSRLRPPSAGYSKRRPADLAAGLLGGTPAGSSTPVGERTALPADRRRWRSPAVPRRSCSSRWSRCSGRSSRG